MELDCGHIIYHATHKMSSFTYVLRQLQSAKYYSIMVDGTPDESCVEQCTFIFHYVLHDDDGYSIKVI